MNLQELIQIHSIREAASAATGNATEGQFEVVAYCTEQYPHICGGNAYTYTGTPVQAGLTVAVDPEVIPLGSWLYIDGAGWRQAQDTGGAIQGRRIDMAVETHGEALEWGVQEKQIYILRERGPHAEN